MVSTEVPMPGKIHPDPKACKCPANLPLTRNQVRLAPPKAAAASSSASLIGPCVCAYQMYIVDQQTIPASFARCPPSFAQRKAGRHHHLGCKEVVQLGDLGQVILPDGVPISRPLRLGERARQPHGESSPHLVAWKEEGRLDIVPRGRQRLDDGGLCWCLVVGRNKINPVEPQEKGSRSGPFYVRTLL
jgi:hypothetical protein